MNPLQRYPFCAVVGRELSMQFGADSYAARREIRSCHIGNGRSCYHHERKVFPEKKSYAMISHARACKKMEQTHFPRVNLVTAEGILVITHLGSIAGETCRRLMIQLDPWESGWWIRLMWVTCLVCRKTAFYLRACGVCEVSTYNVLKSRQNGSHLCAGEIEKKLPSLVRLNCLVATDVLTALTIPYTIK